MSAMKIKLVPIEEETAQEQENKLTLGEFAAMGLAVAGALGLSLFIWRKLTK